MTMRRRPGVRAIGQVAGLWAALLALVGQLALGAAVPRLDRDGAAPTLAAASGMAVCQSGKSGEAGKASLPRGHSGCPTCPSCLANGHVALLAPAPDHHHHPTLAPARAGAITPLLASSKASGAPAYPTGPPLPA